VEGGREERAAQSIKKLVWKNVVTWKGGANECIEKKGGLVTQPSDSKILSRMKKLFEDSEKKMGEDARKRGGVRVRRGGETATRTEEKKKPAPEKKWFDQGPRKNSGKKKKKKRDLHTKRGRLRPIEVGENPERGRSIAVKRKEEETFAASELWKEVKKGGGKHQSNVARMALMNLVGRDQGRAKFWKKKKRHVTLD